MDSYKFRQELAKETRNMVLSFGIAFFPEMVSHFKKEYGKQLNEDEIIDTIDRAIRKMEKEQQGHH